MCTDTSDLSGSSMFNDSDPESGLGGWGNPDNYDEVEDGGFASFKISYPYPHTLRRSFTLQPFVNVQPPLAQFYSDSTVDANLTLTYSAIASIINGTIGDYPGFQKSLEGFQGPLYAVHRALGKWSNFRVSFMLNLIVDPFRG